MRDTPVLQLFIAGLVLSFLTIGLVISMSGGSPDEVYVPSHMKDGKLIPGTFKKPSELAPPAKAPQLDREALKRKLRQPDPIRQKRDRERIP